MRRSLTRFAALSITVILGISTVACSSKSDNRNDTTAETTTVAAVEESTRQVASWSDEAIIYEVNVRQYTEDGTFAAFSEHLDRLKEMGINTLWFMPIYPISEEGRKGSLGSYYAIKDYTDINSEFGNLDDFKKLVDKAHSMGFTVILDWVANHTGWDHKWITEHPEYYLKGANGKIISPPGQNWDDVAQLDFNNSDMRKAMIEAMSFWITEVDVDGFRCDYASGVPVDFWNETREALNKLKDIYMLAEDGTQSNALLMSAFDSDYGFKLYDTLVFVSKGAKHAKDLEYLITAKLPEGAFVMNFIENHDKNSYDGSLRQRFTAEAIGALTTMMFTLKGAPLIYSGQEEGIDKTLAFFDKDLIPFKDYTYAPLITKLSEIRHEHTALRNRTGGDVNYVDTGNKDVLMFTRETKDDRITVIINMSADKTDVSLPDVSGEILLNGNAKELISSKSGEFNSKNIASLDAWEYIVIE